MNQLASTWFVLMITASTVFARIILLRHVDSYHYPRYAFKYSVHDPKTKDHKEHWEARNGDLVKGAYSLVEPDGKLRVVDYWADNAHGFNADVQRLAPLQHPPASKPAPIVEQPQEIIAEVPQEKTVESETASPNPESDADSPVTNNVSNEVLKPLAQPVNYGFGSAGDSAPYGLVYTNVSGTGSLRWDPKTNSYGGWVPLKGRDGQYATIFSKKYIDGKLHEWAIGPISLVGRTLVFKVKHP